MASDDTDETLDKADGSIFVCFVCEMEFTKISLLNAHMKSHEQEDEPGVVNIHFEESEISGSSMKTSVEKESDHFSNSLPNSKNGSTSKPSLKSSASIRSKAMRYQQLLQAREAAKNNTPETNKEGEEVVESGILSSDMMFYTPSSEPAPDVLDPDKMFYAPPTKLVNSAAALISSEPEGFYIPSEHHTFSALDQPVCIKKHVTRKRGRPRLLQKLALSGEEEDDDDDGSQAFTAYSLAKAAGIHSGENSLSHYCHECGKRFSSGMSLAMHEKTHQKVREIVCPYCHKVFPQRYLLRQHLVEEHEDSLSNLVCPMCQKVFTRPDSLKSHMVRMHEEDGGLTCHMCGKHFPSQGQLEMHIRVHTGERPFRCEVCGRGFVQKVHLRTHLRTMHNVSKALTTPCRICNVMVDGRIGLKEHYTKVHNMTIYDYKMQVSKLRKECKIPDLPPANVKVVEPNFRYHKVSVANLNSTARRRSRGRRRRGFQTGFKREESIYVEDDDDDDDEDEEEEEDDDDEEDDDEDDVDYADFAPRKRNLHERRRDKDELNIVESAFKVAEQMDQLVEDGSCLLVPGELTSGADMYRAVASVAESDSKGGKEEAVSLHAAALPDMMPVDDEYAQFTAEHAHVDSEVYTECTGKGVMIKEEPSVPLFSGATEASAASLEMYSSL